MDNVFEKIRRDDRTLYIKKDIRAGALGEALLTGEEGLRKRYELKRVLSSDYARIHTFVAEINGVAREVYLKQYLLKTIREFFKSLFFGSRAMRDYENSRMMAANGFEVPQVIAMGQCRGGLSEKGSFLATLAIEGAIPVSHFIRKSYEDEGQRRKLLRGLMREIGQATGKMHKRGIFHGDLRIGNILFRQENRKLRLFFLDNERTRKFDKLPDSLRIKNLVQINIVAEGKLSNTDRMRFFKAYFEQAGINKEQGKAIIKTVFEQIGRRTDERKQRRKEIKSSARTKEGDLFVEGGDYRGVFRDGFCADSEALFFMERIDGLISTGRIIKDERDCLVSVIKWQDRKMTAQRFNPQGLFKSLGNTIFKSPARRKWLNSKSPLAYIERRKTGLVWKSYFVEELT